MDLTKLSLDVIEPLEQVYKIVLRKPFLTVNIEREPQRAGNNKASIEFTVANEGSSDMEARRIWFLTSYNRPVYSETLDARTPLKMPVNARATFSVHLDELKSALNKAMSETVIKVVVADQNGGLNSGRLSPALQAELSR
jgi:hypothetical protein